MVNENKEKERDKKQTGNKEKKKKAPKSRESRGKTVRLNHATCQEYRSWQSGNKKDKDTCTVKQRMKGTLGRFRTRIAFNEEQDFYSTASPLWFLSGCEGASQWLYKIRAICPSTHMLWHPFGPSFVQLPTLPATLSA